MSFWTAFSATGTQITLVSCWCGSAVLIRKPQVSSSNLEVGSNTNLAISLHKPAVFGAYLEQEVASWSAVFWSEPDRLRHQGTLGVAIAWKWEMRTEVTPSNLGRCAGRCRQPLAAISSQSQLDLKRPQCSLPEAALPALGFPRRVLSLPCRRAPGQPLQREPSARGSWQSRNLWHASQRPPQARAAIDVDHHEKRADRALARR